MKYIKVFLTSITFFILFGCIEKNNQSRQFEKLIKTPALSVDEKEIIISVRNYYKFTSEQSEPFDEKGYFIDKKENNDHFIESIIRSSVRSVIGRYNLAELSVKDRTELENEIYDSANSIIKSNKKDRLNVQINFVLLEEIIFPESIEHNNSNETN